MFTLAAKQLKALGGTVTSTDNLFTLQAKIFGLQTAGGGGIAEAPTDGKNYERANSGWTADPIQADAPNDGNLYGRKSLSWIQVPAGSSIVVTGNIASARAVAETYCGNLTPGTTSWLLFPDLNPQLDFIAYVKSVLFFPSQYGPAPTTSTFQLQMKQDGGTAIPLHTAATLSTLAMPVANTVGVGLIPALSAGVQNNVFLRKTANGLQPSYGVLMNVTPGNAGASPAIGFGVELGFLQHY